MADDERYERVVLLSVWDGLVGVGSHVGEAVVMRCTRCESLVMPERTEHHDQWHRALNQTASRASTFGAKIR